jgi:protocatechuate 3,4-dioxygenase beta subunit
MPINLPIPSSLYTTNPVGVFDTESGTFGSNESINTNEAVENNIIFEGIVLDKDAKPIPGVTITFT